MVLKNNKLLMLFFSTIITLGLFVPSVEASASSNALSEQQIADAKKQRGDELSDFMNELHSKKIRIKALNNQLNGTDGIIMTQNDISSITSELENLKKDVAYTEANLESLTGLVKVDNTEEHGILLPAADGQVSFSGSLYYDSIWTDSWIATVDYEWVDREYLNQRSGYGNVGGYEGFSIGLNRQALTHSTSAYVYDYWEGKIQNDVQFYQNYSNYGRAWRWQDRIFAGSVRNYNSHYGNFNFYFEFVTPPGSGAKTQHYGTYAHTWDQTSVNSIGIGPYSASFGWTNEGKQWTDAGQWIYTH
ncbi:hypothetical protein JCM10914A_10680 [Paenibacillus sp. JCM 10914]|uniref:hypothetical protein n=1 Tax=Paenibacillus sp. JCM 10914 TaxID=1236974 RepID=UPI0003CC3FD6|nr:hypothetical protein [Paenibacillus sp. JCM 10914]GAE08187.1 hypothetical protein JCM10914_4457 [Paenibacillus sp. JCM 10914]